MHYDDVDDDARTRAARVCGQDSSRAWLLLSGPRSQVLSSDFPLHCVYPA